MPKIIDDDEQPLLKPKKVVERSKRPRPVKVIKANQCVACEGSGVSTRGWGRPPYQCPICQGRDIRDDKATH